MAHLRRDEGALVILAVEWTRHVVCPRSWHAYLKALDGELAVHFREGTP